MPAGAPYLVAIFALLLSASCALTLFYVVRHFDPPAQETSPEHAREKVAV